ncbi:class I SAM-dependent methyltransferase [Thiohalorhabdus sp. Cl-TMA]|uniref:Class I SAM-dependent methyltransferase n=1 Tax=Thiohalorhabdus methylotrophus TaxID=3242694 RepID=A0ABV4TWL1_9GAMM
MSAPDWDARYRDRSVAESAPVAVLSENQHLLPQGGMALDLASGLGANAVLLAQQGLKTFAWDSSPVAVEKLQAWSRENLLPITAEVRDVAAWPPEPERFDVIVVGHFLERPLAGALMDALCPDGLLFYQTFTRTRVSDRGPGTDRFRLADNELLHMFDALRILVYREEGRVGDRARGFRDEAQLVAHKPG